MPPVLFLNLERREQATKGKGMASEMTVGSITHVAGLMVAYEGRFIQRCALCGFKLIDTTEIAQPVEADGTVTMWIPGRMVRVEDEGHATVLPELSPAPDDYCIWLVE